MNLKTYFSGQRGRAANLARSIRVTPVTIHQWAFKEGKKIPAERCLAIEKATDGAVTCEEMRPDVDWAYLRGTSKIPPPGDAGSEKVVSAGDEENA
jgi:DNA-binding transcriptional regulator YdaS (Cro superfamily)